MQRAAFLLATQLLPLGAWAQGTVSCWGYDGYHQSSVPSGLSDVVYLTIGWEHACAVIANGGLTCWGRDKYGETEVPASLPNVQAVSAGAYHTCVLTEASGVVCWGRDHQDQSTVPAELSSNVVKLASSTNHNCAITTALTVTCWGDDRKGQSTVPAGLSGVVEVAIGYEHSCALASPGENAVVTCWGSNSKGETSLPAGLDTAVNITARAWFTCALTASKTVVCWGDDSYGQSAVPAGLPDVASVTAGSYHTCVITMAGAIMCWGRNGIGDYESEVPSGLPVATQLASGAHYNCMVTVQATVACWGRNSVGATAPPSGLVGVVGLTSGGHHSCAATKDGMTVCWGHNEKAQATPPAGLGAVQAISAGSEHTCAIIAGDVTCWGRDGDGEASVPTLSSAATAISLGSFHSCALLADASVVCWGKDNKGQSTVPAGLAGVQAISAGGQHNCVILAARTVQCWGWDGDGQSSVPAGLSNVVAIAAGGYHTCALTTAVSCWGRNDADQASVPVGVQNVVIVSANEYHTCAVTASKETVCWGKNKWGQTDVPSDVTETSVLAVGHWHTCAVNGTVVSITTTTQTVSSTSTTSLTTSATVTSTATQTTTSTHSTSSMTTVSETTAATSTSLTWTATATATSTSSVSTSSTNTESTTGTFTASTTLTVTATSMTISMTGSTTGTSTTTIVTTAALSTTTGTDPFFTPTSSVVSPSSFPTLSSAGSTTVVTSTVAATGSGTLPETSIGSSSSDDTVTGRTSLTVAAAVQPAIASSTAASEARTSLPAATIGSSSSDDTVMSTTSLTVAAAVQSTAASEARTSLAAATVGATTTGPDTSILRGAAAIVARTSSSSAVSFPETTSTAAASLTDQTIAAAAATSDETASGVAPASTSTPPMDQPSPAPLATPGTSALPMDHSTLATAAGFTSSSAVDQSTAAPPTHSTLATGFMSSSAVDQSTAAPPTETGTAFLAHSTQRTSTTAAPTDSLGEVPSTIAALHETGSSPHTTSGSLTSTSMQGIPQATSDPPQADSLDPTEVLLHRLNSTVTRALWSLGNKTGSSLSSPEGEVEAVTLASAADVAGGKFVRLERTGIEVTLPSSLLENVGLAEWEDLAIVVTVLSASPVGQDASLRAVGVASLDLGYPSGKLVEVGNLTSPIVFSLPADYSMGMRCAFWDKGDWSTEGLEVSETSVLDAPIVCSTTHFTVFAAILEGFVATFECSQLSLLNAEALAQVVRGKWYSNVGSILFFILMAAMSMTFVTAAYLDWRRAQWFTWTTEFFLLPLDMVPHRRNSRIEVPQSSLCICCPGSTASATCLKETAFKNALDEIVSEWFSYFADLRSFVESIWSGLDISAVLACNISAMREHLASRLLSVSARHLAATSTGLSDDVIKFVLEDEDFLHVVAELHSRSREQEDAMTSQASQASQDSPQRCQTVQSEPWVVRALTAGPQISAAVWKTARCREDAWKALQEEVTENLPQHVSRHSWSALPQVMLDLFRGINPVGTTLAISIFASCKMRALMLIVEVSGSLLVTSLFFTATGTVRGKGRSNAKCHDDDLQSQLSYQVGRCLAIAVGAVVVSWIPVAFLGSLRTVGFKKFESEGCPEWRKQLRIWAVQERLVWICGSLYIAACLLFTVTFLANIGPEDHEQFTLAAVVSFLQDAFILPMGLSLFLPLTAQLFLSCHGSREEHDQIALIRRVYREIQNGRQRTSSGERIFDI